MIILEKKNMQLCYNCGASVDLKHKDYPVCDDCSSDVFDEIVTFEKKVNQALPDINQISDKIYLGGRIISENKDFLLSLGIKDIIICSNKLKPPFPKDFRYFKLINKEVFSESIDISEYLDECFDFIDGSEKVLIYCETGNSMSAAVVLGYLIFNMDYSFKKGIEFLRGIRKGILPTDSYIEQIKLLVKEINEINK